MKAMKKPIKIEVCQWFKHGDHPNVKPSPMMVHGPDGVYPINISPENGWIETLENSHEVTPGDWIAKGIFGELYPIKPDIFEKTYDIVED